MSFRRGVAAAVLLILTVFLWWRFKPAPASSNPGVLAPATSTSSGIGITVRQTPSPPERSTLADELNSPSRDIHADLRLVSSIIETFRSNFLQTGNPVGSNAEITSALIGRNRLRLALIPPDHPAINQEGELCDRWGTPFFFHSESATRMEIRSAGPDRKMWNEDDVVYAP